MTRKSEETRATWIARRMSAGHNKKHSRCGMRVDIGLGIGAIRIFGLIIGAVCLLGTVSGQTAESVGRFEVADVHPSANSANPRLYDLIGGLMSGGLMRGDLYSLKGATMLDLIRTAYRIDPQRVIGGPAWLGVNRFDVRARVPTGTTAATVNPMLQGLLADRFGLVIRNDKRPVPGWALTANKSPQLKQSDGSGNSGCRAEDQAGAEQSQQTGQLLTIECHNITMADFAAHLNDMKDAWNYIGDKPVADQTGLEGAWDFGFQYTRRFGVSGAGAEAVNLSDGLEKIGLKLDPAAILVPVIVVEKVNQTPTPNSTEASAAFPPPPTEFEVAEVKMTNPDFRGLNVFQIQPGGAIRVRGATLKFLIQNAWGLSDDMLVGAPKFLDTDRWDIVAKAPGMGQFNYDIEALLQMVKGLLSDRFRLVMHTDERSISAFALTAPKPKMKRADPTSRAGCKEGPPTLAKTDSRNSNPGLGLQLTCTNVTMAYFADQLQYLANGYVHYSVVLDSTGLEGGWDFTLSFSTLRQFQGGTPAPPGTGGSVDPNGAVSLPEAMEKQLGLRLERVKRPLPVFVIDHIEQKPTDN